MNQNNFDWFANLPLIFFALCFFANFAVFAWAGLVFLTSKEDLEKKEKGKKILSYAFTFLFIILLLLAVFFIISYLLQQGQVFTASPDASKEFPPPAHLGVFPPGQEYIKIGNYNFTGPWPFSADQGLKSLAVWAIMCKNEDKYDALYFSDNTRAAFGENEQYTCWVNNCGKNVKNLYVAILWTPASSYDAVEKGNIPVELSKQINAPCKDEKIQE